MCDVDFNEGHDLKFIQLFVYNSVAQVWPLKAASEPQPGNVYIYIRTAQLIDVLKNSYS